MDGKKTGLRRAASCVVLWTGLAIIGVIAVPAGLLLSVIYALGRAFSFINDRLSK